MKKIEIMALLLGATLFAGLGATSLFAGDMKCGAGKCGSSMEKPAAKCGGDKKMPEKAGKCGGDKKMPEKAGKCGAGKCG